MRPLYLVIGLGVCYSCGGTASPNDTSLSELKGGSEAGDEVSGDTDLSGWLDTGGAGDRFPMPSVNAEQDAGNTSTDRAGTGSARVGGSCASDADCDSHYCASGTCVAGAACATRAVSCAASAPTCDGSIPSVVNGCWEDCVESELCADVDACSACSTDQVCVRTYFETSPTGPYERFSCGERPTRCDEPTCDCLGELCRIGSCGLVDDAVRCLAGGSRDLE